MQGTWKDAVSGWNHKDSRRKKQTRNHMLRDRGCYFARKEPVKSVRYESEVDVKDEVVVKHGTTKTIYKIKINKYFDKYSTRVAYVTGRGYYTTWRDAYTDNVIDLWGKGKPEILAIVWQEYTHFNEPKVHDTSRRWGRADTNSTLFIFDKPVYNWKRWTFFDDGKRRKFAQKMVNKRDRAIVREYVNKGDWDVELKTHALSKSVAWEIY